jgi:enolase
LDPAHRWPSARVTQDLSACDRAEDDWDGWVRLTEELGSKVQLVGDDIFVTNPAIIRRGIDKKVANAALIKVNQIGTVTETLEAMAVCREAGYAATVSHRSRGDRGQLHRRPGRRCWLRPVEIRRPARGERVAKYNRLLEIADSNRDLAYGLPDR